ncbi:hypothetical protein DVA86_32830 [Streptomyces armeniacus]|uniref:Protein kinase domain-containing protein n=1 Tax=Streptomyces armeniacus TaxID=83291 RepID=A0A345XYC8_9ACTN|nr:hypothetical protein [Streptomyces armeniacus]AXK36644.1 hypothetical protein DVA86_32830 [Streptomyces armeniacus]
MTAADGADVRLQDLAPGDKIGDGGQGEVRTVHGQDGMLYKSYRSPEKVNGQALATLVSVRRSLPEPERDQLDAQAAWPLCRVMDGPRTAGFLMRRAPASMTWQTANGGSKLTELQFLLHSPRPQWQDIVQPGPGQRRELALALVELIDRLHSWRLVLGDVSQANVLWTVRPQTGVFLLDCDGFRAAGESPVLAQADTVDWNDAAAPPGTATVDSDRYKAALAVGRILAQDAYAAPGKPLTLVAGELDDRQEAAVRRRFDEAAGAYGTRPTLAEWRTALSPRDVIKLTAATPAPRPPVNREVLDSHRTRGTIPLRQPDPP